MPRIPGRNSNLPGLPRTTANSEAPPPPYLNYEAALDLLLNIQASSASQPTEKSAPDPLFNNKATLCILLGV